ncbi:MAG TPA: ribonuclease Z [Ignavibacteria bacterium]
MIEVVFLGTGSALPTKERMLPSIAINYNGETILFDCGEGTQFQMSNFGIKPFKIKNIFISHLHGDHFFGLPGLLSTMNLFKRTEEINIFGPEGIKNFLFECFKITNMTKRYDINITEIPDSFEGGILFENENYFIQSIPLEHSIFDLGFRFQEKNKPGHYNLEKAKKFNLPIGPLIGELKKGNSVFYNNQKINPEDVLDELIKGKSITIITDTKFSENAIKLAKDTDLLIHEATFEESLIDKAKEMNHSTTIDAAQTALLSNSQKLIITHISARNEDLDKLVNECKKIFINSHYAYDSLRIIL